MSLCVSLENFGFSLMSAHASPRSRDSSPAAFLAYPSPAPPSSSSASTRFVGTPAMHYDSPSRPPAHLPRIPVSSLINPTLREHSPSPPRASAAPSWSHHEGHDNPLEHSAAFLQSLQAVIDSTHTSKQRQRSSTVTTFGAEPLSGSLDLSTGIFQREISHPYTRVRTAHACDACRKRKAKCSGEKVCGRCLRRGLNCVYSEGRTRGSSRKRADTTGDIGGNNRSPSPLKSHETDTHAASTASTSASPFALGGPSPTYSSPSPPERDIPSSLGGARRRAATLSVLQAHAHAPYPRRATRRPEPLCFSNPWDGKSPRHAAPVSTEQQPFPNAVFEQTIDPLASLEGMFAAPSESTVKGGSLPEFLSDPFTPQPPPSTTHGPASQSFSAAQLNAIPRNSVIPFEMSAFAPSPAESWQVVLDATPAYAYTRASSSDLSISSSASTSSTTSILPLTHLLDVPISFPQTMHQPSFPFSLDDLAHAAATDPDLAPFFALAGRPGAGFDASSALDTGFGLGTGLHPGFSAAAVPAVPQLGAGRPACGMAEREVLALSEMCF